MSRVQPEKLFMRPDGEAKVRPAVTAATIARPNIIVRARETP